MRKYRFKEEFADAQIAIPGYRELITNHNLSDKEAENILKKFPQFAHNIEEIPKGESYLFEAPEVEKVVRPTRPVVSFAPEAESVQAPQQEEPVIKSPRKRNRGNKKASA